MSHGITRSHEENIQSENVRDVIKYASDVINKRAVLYRDVLIKHKGYCSKTEITTNLSQTYKNEIDFHSRKYNLFLYSFCPVMAFKNYL